MINKEQIQRTQNLEVKGKIGKGNKTKVPNKKVDIQNFQQKLIVKQSHFSPFILSEMSVKNPQIVFKVSCLKINTN